MGGGGEERLGGLEDGMEVASQVRTHAVNSLTPFREAMLPSAATDWCCVVATVGTDCRA